ncbi:MAG: ABC transporter substrate-binding protein [Chloroflexi bacterium]|nr:ABC transporter substrate-binding protein [Chloroflexota bacterium]
MTQARLFWLGILALAFAACAPAAQETATPVRAAAPPTSARSAPAATPTLAPAAAPTTAPAAGPTTAPTPKPTATQVASAQAPKTGGILQLAARVDESRIEIHIATGARELRRGTNIAMQRVLGTKPEDCAFTEIVPNLAKEWGWTSDTEFRVKLNQGVRFHDKPPAGGREMTSDDVAYSLNRYFREQDSAVYKDTKAEVVDRYTVRFVTKGPLLDFALEALARDSYGNDVVAPEAVGPKLNDMKRREQWIGTGPFVFERYVPGVKLVYSKHASYFKQGLPYLAGVEFNIIPEMSTRLAVFRGGKLDILDGLGLLEADALKKIETRAEYHACPDMSFNPTLTLRNDLPPFNDIRVRRALSMAVNREGMNHALLGGQGSIVAFMPLQLPGALRIEDYAPEVRQYFQYNPAQAKKLLAEAGFPNGFTTTLHYNTQKFGRIHTSMSEGMAASLNEIGISVKLVGQTHAEWSQTTQPGDYPGIGAQSMSVDSLVKYATGFLPGSDFTVKNHLNDPTLEKMAARILVTTNEAEVAKLVREIQVYLADKMYFIAPPMGGEFGVAQAWVKGWWFPAIQWREMDVTLEKVWLAK